MKKRPVRINKKGETEKKLVTKANSLENPLSQLTAFHRYTTEDNKLIKLDCTKAKSASVTCKTWIMDIMERNMKHLYEQSDWGWDPDKKEKELTEPQAWYLLASLNDEFIGFSHFRFDIDNHDAILYCYELQLEESVRRKGLGQFMMKTLEAMATENKMRRVVLTVLKCNPAAVQFFSSIGYRPDRTNPARADYLIVSKDTQRSNEKS